MLEQILHFIHNYFEREIIKGTFVVSSGSIDLPFLQEGQYFRIVGSVFNDGIHSYPTSNLTDERFEGEIWVMAVPPAVIALTSEIEEWCTTNGGDSSPFISESFGGYSYSKGTASSANGATVPIGWREVFAPQLNQWRKIA